MRGDLACLSLAGTVFAPHYVVPDPWKCSAASASVHAEPKSGSIALSELLEGEPFQLMDRTGDWSWGQAADGSCGFVQSYLLAPGEGTLVIGEVDDIASFAAALVGASYAEGGQGGAGWSGAGMSRRAALADGIELPAFADLQEKALPAATGPARGVALYAGDIAAICVSESDAVAALPDRGVVKVAIAELSGDGDASYRNIAP